MGADKQASIHFTWRMIAVWVIQRIFSCYSPFRVIIGDVALYLVISLDGSMAEKVTPSYNGYVFDERTGLLKHDNGQTSRLRDKAQRVFCLLSSSPGQLFTRQQIMDTVWKNVCVTDDSIGQCIRDIRAALLDQSKSTVVTVPRKGYRLVPDSSSAVTDMGAETYRQLQTPVAIPDSDRIRVVIVTTAEFCLQDNTARFCCRSSSRLGLELQVDLARFSSLDIKQCTVTADSVWEQKTDLSHLARMHQAGYLLLLNTFCESGGAKFLFRLINAGTGQTVWADKQKTHPGMVDAHYASMSGKAAIKIEQIVRKDRSSVAQMKDEVQLNAEDHYAIGLNMVSDSLDSNLIARNHFKLSLQLAPESSAAIAGYARSFVIDAVFNYSDNVDNNLEKANALLSGASMINDYDGRVLAETGHLFSVMKEFVRAREYFQRALEINPLDTESMVRFGWSLAFSGRPNEGLSHISNALRLHPFSPGWYTWNYGIAAFLAGEYQLAYRALKKYCAYRPEHPRPYRLLAVAASVLGSNAEAATIVERITERDPLASLAVESELQHRLLSDVSQVDTYLEHLSAAGMPS